MAHHGMVQAALAPAHPLIDSLGVGKSAKVPSVKEQQDKPDTLHRIHQARGHG